MRKGRLFILGGWPTGVQLSRLFDPKAVLPSTTTRSDPRVPDDAVGGSAVQGYPLRYHSILGFTVSSGRFRARVPFRVPGEERGKKGDITGGKKRDITSDVPLSDPVGQRRRRSCGGGGASNRLRIAGSTGISAQHGGAVAAGQGPTPAGAHRHYPQARAGGLRRWRSSPAVPPNSTTPAAEGSGTGVRLPPPPSAYVPAAR
jgi:hypothetical protein